MQNSQSASSLNSISCMSERIISILEKQGVIPPGQFLINDNTLDAYMAVYNQVTGGNGKAKPSNTRYNRKIAALNLIKYKKRKGLSIPEGFVYVISNPAWDNKYKVGMSSDPKKRLASYQTYSPNRDFKLEHWSFWEDRRKAEKFVLSISNVYSHEWITLDREELENHLSRINNKGR